jgi:hypothetical protein
MEGVDVGDVGVCGFAGHLDDLEFDAVRVVTVTHEPCRAVGFIAASRKFRCPGVGVEKLAPRRTVAVALVDGERLAIAVDESMRTSKRECAATSAGDGINTAEHFDGRGG